MRRALFSRPAIWGLVLLTLLFGYGRFLYPRDALTPSGPSLQKPCAAHVLGTDNLGIDIFAQLSRGFFASMAVGLAAAGLALLLGGALGMLAGYLGGAPDLIVGFLINVLLAIPQLPALIALGAFLGQGGANVALLVALFSWAPIARQMRAKTMSLRARPFVTMAASFGGGARYVIWRHMLPELAPLLAASGLSVVGKAIMQESALAFLGLSDPLAKSWGLMIQRASAFPGIYFTPYWSWWLLPPVAALMGTILLTRLLARHLDETNWEEARRWN